MSATPALKSKVGVLALQGCVEPHRVHVESLGFEFVVVKSPEQLKDLSALILPGGESTTLLKLIKLFSFEEPLKRAAEKIPFWGICAGAILMAQHVRSPEQASLGIFSMTAERNSYGRQQESFEQELNGYRVAFIRAPRFFDLGPQVEILEKCNGSVVAAREGRHLVSSFHAELNPQTPSPFHKRFLIDLSN